MVNKDLVLPCVYAIQEASGIKATCSQQQAQAGCLVATPHTLQIYCNLILWRGGPFAFAPRVCPP